MATDLANVPYSVEGGEPFVFFDYERISPLYRYPVLTDQVAYLERTIRRCIDESLLDESRFLMQFDRARRQIEERLNLPSRRLDLLIQMIRQNNGVLSRTKRSKFHDLSDEAVEIAEEAVRAAFKIGR